MTITLPPEQQAIRDQCIHRAGTVTEFTPEDVEQSIAVRFEKLLAKYANRDAVKTMDCTLTYAELNRAANRVAHTILSQRGEGEEPIALLVEQGITAVIMLLGVLKAGKFYVPLNPSYPRARLVDVVRDVEPALILSSSLHFSLACELAEDKCPVVNYASLDASRSELDPKLEIRPDALGYLFYTSGSTGRPKGVPQSQRNILHQILTYSNGLHISPDDRITMLHSHSFSASRLDIFGALLNGATLFPLSVAEAGITSLINLLKDEKITISHWIPTLFRHVVNVLGEHEQFPMMRVVVLGSEPVLLGDIGLYKSHFAEDCILVNRFGSTETGNICWNFFNHQSELSSDVVPAGYRVPGVDVFMIDENGAKVHAGDVGEVCVQSRYLSQGYWKKPELTEAVFRPDPSGGDRRIYLTGDLGRMHADGCLDHLGRKDSQIKIRGFRVELGEIEAVLQQHSMIHETVVVARDEIAGDKRLVAYVVTAQQAAPTTNELKSFLNGKLPEYMIPSAFVYLDALPLTATGKVDRKTLQSLDPAEPLVGQPSVAPHTAVEELLANLWVVVLKVQKVGVHDNFFDLGGNSLLVSKMIAQLRRKLGVDLPVRTLFEAPTIAQLAARLEHPSKPMVSLNGRGNYSHLIELRSGPKQKPIFCFPYRCGVQGEYTHFLRLAKYMEEYSFYGLQAKAADSHTPPHASVEELATNYVREIEDFHPNGPYYLIGDCAGAPEAYETARQLSMRGEKVGLLVLLDAKGPYMPGRYWRLGPYSIKDLDLLRSRLLSSRFGMWCRNLAAASSFHWQESGKLPHGERWRYLGRKVFGMLKTQIGASQKYFPEPSQESEEVFSASEDELLQHVAHTRRQYRTNWPSDYSGPLAVIVNQQWYGFDRTFGWAEMAAGGVETYAIRGDHISYMLEHVPMVANQIRACLEKVM